MSTMSDKPWIVGLDLRDRSDGAIAFARWLSDRTAASSGGARPKVHGAHVLERDKLRFVQEKEDLAQIEKMTRLRMHDVLRHAGALEVFDEPELVVDDDADEALTRLVQTHEAAMLLVGRKAKIGTDPVVRLGRVARRLLRTLPCPVVVTPPDLDASAVGKGPIIVGTDCQDDAREAVDFAVDMGARIGRDVLLAHVVPMPEEWGAHYLPTASVAHVRSELQASGEITLERWAKEQGLQGHAGVVLQGGVLPRLIELARDNASPLIVTGSRGLGPVARFFVASVGSELAASAPCPVAVVPA